MDETTNYLPEIQDGRDLINEVPDFLKEDEWFEVDIEGNMLDVTQDYALPRFALKINGVPCAPVGGLHGITGQPGHGKTMTLTMIMAAYLGDKKHGMEYNLSETIPHPKVLYIDTEMEKGNTMMVYYRVCAMLGWGFHERHEELQIMTLREEVSAEMRYRKMLKAIHTYKPTAVFLDGLIDIVADFNDNQLCQEIIFKLMKTATHYDINLWPILHLNPNSTKMVGHTGSFLERKATDLFETKKQKNELTDRKEFTIIQRKARGKDIPDLQFYVSDDKHKFGFPVVLGADLIGTEFVTETPRQRELALLFGGMPFTAEGLRWTDIDSYLTSKGTTSNRKKEKLLEEAQTLGVIKKVEKRYYFIYRSKNPESEQGEMPF